MVLFCNAKPTMVFGYRKVQIRYSRDALLVVVHVLQQYHSDSLTSPRMVWSDFEN